ISPHIGPNPRPGPKGNQPAGMGSTGRKQTYMNDQEYSGMHAGAKPELFRFAEKLRANMTEAEMKLWEFLRLKPKGFKFRRQHPFSQFILDFYCHKARLAIEVDGKYHELPEQKKLDETRTNQIESSGIKELRFKNEEVMNQFESVKNSILSHLKP
ncbi:MAG TPA: endonuclease domain-containing protein, partial [Flavilitoribacter sp.]|nr:endonuclease domain-containing protein [Flavilitoribacter sp.]HMQ88944.1 endonuclease domain-containing protein [Flavilitoribacter sp.]